MRRIAIVTCFGLAAIGSAQTIQNVYNRDTEEQFKLKHVKVERTIVGPMVRTSTVLTFENPYKKLTEASLWFGMPEAAALSGFAYYYGDEYVKGRLMDKAKAWFIYTAITSRNEDPGIMDQVSPTAYHAQIYPLKVGHDLRVKLYSVGMLEPGGQFTKVPNPEISMTSNATRESTVRMRGSAAAPVAEDFNLPLSKEPVQAVAQRFKDGRTYVAGYITKKPGVGATIASGLNQVHVVPLNDYSVAFMGWVPKKRAGLPIRARVDDKLVSFRPQRIYKGSETARLWAQQSLAHDEWTSRSKVLKFSMKYGIPSSATAMLAVPSEEMKLFRKKEREYQAHEARQRKAEREAARRQRNWEKTRPQNYNQSSGGDPEIRMSFPNAEKVYALLPDGRVLTLQSTDGLWRTNFEIPADAVEGQYDVKLIALNRDGTREEKFVHYKVDRTAPEGKAEFRRVDGRLVLEVRAEAGLSSVTAWLANGDKLTLIEVDPGVYRVDMPSERPTVVTVMLTDGASNKRTLTCSWSH